MTTPQTDAALLEVYEIDSGPGGVSYEWNYAAARESLAGGADTLEEAIAVARAHSLNVRLHTLERYHAEQDRREAETAEAVFWSAVGQWRDIPRAGTRDDVEAALRELLTVDDGAGVRVLGLLLDTLDSSTKALVRIQRARTDPTGALVEMLDEGTPDESDPGYSLVAKWWEEVE